MRLNTFFLTSWCVVVVCYFFTSGIFDISIRTMEGNEHKLSKYEGKKILVVTLPVTRNVTNDSLLTILDSFAAANQHRLVVIGVPSYEGGYIPGENAHLPQWYRSFLRSTVIVTEGMFTRRASGVQQHALFKWLTKKEENGTFDIDAVQPWQKYFVRRAGTLQAVFDHTITLNSRVVNYIVEAAE